MLRKAQIACEEQSRPRFCSRFEFCVDCLIYLTVWSSEMAHVRNKRGDKAKQVEMVSLLDNLASHRISFLDQES